MAEVAADTASPEVVPTLTKTDARELKSLVSRDTKILLEELEFRHERYRNALDERRSEELRAIMEEREARDEADQVLLEKEMGKIQRRIDTLNEAIRETLGDLAEAGWRSPGADTIINKGQWEVGLNLGTTRYGGVRLLPPTRDDEDLAARDLAAKEEYSRAVEALDNAYNEARRQVTGREADVLRDLTLQSITTEAAREFILEMPTSDDLLPAPSGLDALPPPVGEVIDIE